MNLPEGLQLCRGNSKLPPPQLVWTPYQLKNIPLLGFYFFFNHSHNKLKSIKNKITKWFGWKGKAHAVAWQGHLPAPRCSKSCPAWLWTLLGMGIPYSSPYSSHSNQRRASIYCFDANKCDGDQTKSFLPRCTRRYQSAGAKGIFRAIFLPVICTLAKSSSASGSVFVFHGSLSLGIVPPTGSGSPSQLPALSSHHPLTTNFHFI